MLPQLHSASIQMMSPGITCLLYTPVFGGDEHLRRTLIGRVVGFGILRDVATVRGLLGIWGVLSTAAREVWKKLALKKLKR